VIILYIAQDDASRRHAILTIQFEKLNIRKVQKYNLTTALSSFTNMLTYDHTGFVDYSYLLDEYNTASDKMAEISSTILKNSLQDMSIRQGMALGGWKPKVDDMAAQAVDWLSGGLLHSLSDRSYSIPI
jgi:hypothetical protein